MVPGNQEQSSPSPTHVVTCFLLRQHEGHDEVLLVRRSQRVRTYRGAWAGVSGYLEPGVTPLEQAYTEIREETGLGATDARLLKSGEPLPIHDEDAGIAWVVHPFLFEVRSPTGLTLDWEATESQWAPPDTIRTLSTVPRLADALASVYPVSPDEAHG